MYVLETGASPEHLAAVCRGEGMDGNPVAIR